VIAAQALQGIAFPWALIEASGRLVQSGNGALFPAPAYPIEPIALQAMQVKNKAWATCPNGYAMYRFTSEILAPDFIILHGMKVAGISTTQGRSDALSIRLTPEEVANYVEAFTSGLEALDDQYRALIRQNIHEVRGINSALYNAAFGLQSSIENNQNQQGWLSVTKSVVNLAEILRGRIDFMEFIANPSAQHVAKGEIAVYKKFDKLQRCFRVTAHQRRIALEMSGSSTRTVYGPPIFDLVPYLLLDNAIKYAPNDSTVRIVCNDSERSIFCSVSSLGPRIADDELPSIFLPGVRGRYAIRSGASGSGLGLAALRRIVVDVFSGTVKIAQPPTDMVSINGVPYCQVTFDLKLPTTQYY
jgi:signal transduction histidine kinase